MKHYIAILLFPLLFYGCTKEEQPEGSCHHPKCNRYYQTWETLLKNRNGLSDAYFEKHIRPGTYKIQENENGEMFTIEYTVRIEWAEIELKDQFLIFIKENAFPDKENLEDKGFYLPDNIIDAHISYEDMDGHMTEMDPVEKLSFSSATDAIKVLRRKAFPNSIYFESYGYKKSAPGQVRNGNPYLFGEGEIDPVSRTMLKGEVNLVSRDARTYSAQDKSAVILTH